MFVVSIQQIKEPYLFYFITLFSAKMRLGMTKQVKWLNIEQNEDTTFFDGCFVAAFDLALLSSSGFSVLLLTVKDSIKSTFL